MRSKLPTKSLTHAIKQSSAYHSIASSEMRAGDQRAHHLASDHLRVCEEHLKSEKERRLRSSSTTVNLSCDYANIPMCIPLFVRAPVAERVADEGSYRECTPRPEFQAASYLSSERNLLLHRKVAQVPGKETSEEREKRGEGRGRN